MQYDMPISYKFKRVSKDGTVDMEVSPRTKVFERFYLEFVESKNRFLAG